MPLSKQDRATRAYCQTQARKWLVASQKLRSTISYASHRRQCIREAKGWLIASKLRASGPLHWD